MNLCICDDDAIVHDKIKELLCSFEINEDNISVTDVFSGEELLAHLSDGDRFDIIFLDVEMKNIDGIMTARQIRDTDPEAIIIFVSSHSRYTKDAFRVEALHFIDKPIDPAEFDEVFSRAVKKYCAKNETVTFKWEAERYNLPVSDIVYVEGYNRHIAIVTRNAEFEAMGRIPVVQKVLAPYGFIQLHQGIIVNASYIKVFGKEDVTLKNGKKLAVSVRRRKDALKAYDAYLRNRMW